MSKPRKHQTEVARAVSTAFLSILVTQLPACKATQINENNAGATVDQFMEGRANLTVTFPPWPGYRTELRGIWLRQDWKALAKKTIELGWDNDLSWFYLGEAARGLGLRDAAREYYKHSIADTLMEPIPHNDHACAFYSPAISDDPCNGLQFPRMSQLRLQQL